MTTYLVLILNDYSFTISDGKGVQQYGSQFVNVNLRYRINKEKRNNNNNKQTYTYIKIL